ncbi:MAG: DEAD/DEAH box helicase family protein [Defluviitaleaceae bacterium]|nr:DEAD/DEAH box helicase family protein [Defluviitaleaceae bacterium]
MQPNKYQRKVLKNLRDFLELLDECSPADAYRTLWESRDVGISLAGEGGMPPYRNTIDGVAHVCFKVPTGGGKTFLAACAVRIIKEAIVRGGEGAVVWLVPSDIILEQTLATLRNPDHPYRLQLLKDFPSGVEIYDKEQLLNGQNFQNAVSVQEHLSVFVLSYDSFRSNIKDGRRAFRENERLKDFPVSPTLPEGADETSLVNAINGLNPIVIVDESHRAKSQLSAQMLDGFNPRFILDLTATPRENSNIIAFAEASELKSANMVKLPLVVYNRPDKKDVMQDAIGLRLQLEQQAIEEESKGGKYIRPIVLFQAQQKGKEDATTFQKLKEQLIEGGIPAEQIAIKVDKLNELKNVNLMSRDCEIRYIITVEALKEGWDCPFAYVLATLANKTSKVDVEQIVGRILRQPYARQHGQPLLNNAFVLTCSNDFATTLDGIVQALNTAGFSKKDVRVAEVDLPVELEVFVQPSITDESFEEETVEFLDNYADVIGVALEEKPSSAVSEMLVQAVVRTQEYKLEAEESEERGYLGGLEGAMKNQYKMNDEFVAEFGGLLVPQFCVSSEPDLFSNENYAKLHKEHLSKGFSLANADSNVNFALTSGEMYAVDASNKGAVYRKMTVVETEYVRSKMERLPDEGKRKYCVDLITSHLEQRPIGNFILGKDLYAYVERVVSNLSSDDFAAMQTGFQFYASRILVKIEILLDEHRESRFFSLLESGDILCLPMFGLPKVITPTETLDGLEKSLYESEASVNSVERKVIEEIAALKNIRWWHRIVERKPYSFDINGFVTHYPDFIVMTTKGTLVAIEVKGDDRDNSDSERKLRLGRKWAEKAGDTYRYYMVFDKLNWKKEGAYELSDFVELMVKL